VPYNVSSPDDINAASRSLAFAFGWYFDPIVFGKYPDEMT
jgi:beta-glucosidase/6-phospho-beta-glucosidase/beta-galactosidase